MPGAWPQGEEADEQVNERQGLQVRRLGSWRGSGEAGRAKVAAAVVTANKLGEEAAGVLGEVNKPLKRWQVYVGKGSRWKCSGAFI